MQWSNEVPVSCWYTLVAPSMNKTHSRHESTHAKDAIGNSCDLLVGDPVAYVLESGGNWEILLTLDRDFVKEHSGKKVEDMWIIRGLEISQPPPCTELEEAGGFFD